MPLFEMYIHLLSKKNLFLVFMCMGVLLAYVFMNHVCAGVHRGQKRAFNPLE